MTKTDKQQTEKRRLARQDNETQTIVRAVLSTIFRACRQAEENGWTVAQELGADPASREVEPAHAVLIDRRGVPEYISDGKAQAALPFRLTEASTWIVSQADVNSFCDGFAAGGEGHALKEDPQAGDGWFDAGFRLGEQVERGERPWWDGHTQQRVTTGWVVKGNDGFYLKTPAARLAASGEVTQASVWTNDRTKALVWARHAPAWHTAQNEPEYESGRVVRVVKKLGGA